MSMNLVTLLYLVASVCFIQALKGLSHPTTSIRGNIFGMTGMAIAVLTTAALTGQTTNAFAYVRAATAVAARVTVGSGATLYVNVGTTVATGTVDIYLYGYNAS